MEVVPLCDRRAVPQMAGSVHCYPERGRFPGDAGPIDDVRPRSDGVIRGVIFSWVPLIAIPWRRRGRHDLRRAREAEVWHRSGHVSRLMPVRYYTDQIVR